MASGTPSKGGVTMTFDDWNRQETKRITEREGADVAKLVRKARKGGMFRFMAYADYVEYCETHDITPEALVTR
jgi:hypothetical protein